MRKREIAWEPFQFDFQKDKYRSEGEPLPSFDEDYDDMPAPLAGINMDMDRIMETPFGLFKVDDSMNPFKSFNFWMGHTNFIIDENTFLALDRMLGVESLNVLTPYRFIISVGRAFQWRDVRSQIEHDLCGKHIAISLIKSIENKEVREQAEKVYNELKTNKYWLMYIFPNGNIIHKSFKSHNLYQEEAQTYQESNNISKGILISSDDDDCNK